VQTRFGAANELERFKSLRLEHPEESSGYRPGDETQFEVEGLEASAWLAHARGEDGQAIDLMRRAAAVEDATENRGLFYLARAHEWLGELFLEVRQPGEALAELQKALGSNPNRFRGLAAAFKAARLSGDISSARGYAVQLVSQCEHADSPRPELDEAREFLKQK